METADFCLPQVEVCPWNFRLVGGGGDATLLHQVGALGCKVRFLVKNFGFPNSCSQITCARLMKFSWKRGFSFVSSILLLLRLPHLLTKANGFSLFHLFLITGKCFTESLINVQYLESLFPTRCCAVVLRMLELGSWKTTTFPTKVLSPVCIILP